MLEIRKPENILPAVCGPQCPLYDLKKHRCRVSGDSKQNLEECDFEYSMTEVNNIAKGIPLSVNLPVDTLI